MIFIGEHIIESLKSKDYPCPVTVQDFYKVQKLQTPLITIQELPSNDGVYLDNQPAVTQNTFVIEVYAKSKTIKGKATSGSDLAKQIISVVDGAVNADFGLTMVGNITSQPYVDPAVTRLVARYTAYIDTRTNLIYRRS